LRKATAAMQAVPILAFVTVAALLRRSAIARGTLAIGLALSLALGAVAIGRPTATVATPPTAIVPLSDEDFTTAVATNQGSTEAVSIRFSAPMDHRSVAAAVRVEPATSTSLSWDASSTVLTVAPADHWKAGTFHTVSVQAGALAASGQPLSRPARAVFLTRAAMPVSAAATDLVGTRVSTTSSFVVSFLRPVDPATASTSMRLDPPTAGTVVPVVRPGDMPDDPVQYRFIPEAPLQPNAAYRLIVSGVRDLDGLPLETFTLAVQTASAPAVVRFRPSSDARNVARDAAISVRFTDRMDRRSTARAVTVAIGGRPVQGTVRWAESDTVLVFSPAASLPYATTVSVDVATDARNLAGAPLAAATHGTFRTVAKGDTPARTESDVTAGPGAATGGGKAVGGGSWGAVETYYLGLMNCTRTGGWVTSTGHCNSPGGRSVAPLKLDRGISSQVSRPYAKRLAVGNDCSHFIGGGPDDRLRRAGYRSYAWGENIGCRSGGAMNAVLASHLFFQSEKSYNGGHYVNLMNAKYDRVGIGVWVAGGRVRLVIDFYHP